MTKEKISDPEFKLKLIRLLCRDATFLRECAVYVDPSDFNPQPGESDALLQIVLPALSHWQQYHEPIGRLLIPELKAASELNQWNDRLKQELNLLTSKVFSREVLGAEYVRDNLRAFRQRLAREEALQTVIDLHEAQTLTDAKWLEICSDTVAKFAEAERPATDIYDLDSLESRIRRRSMDRITPRRHMFFIKPLDDITLGIGKGHIGLIMAPYKRGKSLALSWIAGVLTVQGYNVIYFTLEDALPDVEDRMDALMSSTSVKDLSDVPEAFRSRWLNWRRNTKGNLRVVDMRDIETQIQHIEAEYERLRATGFLADAVIIDYDNLLVPERRQQNRKEELTALYRELVRWVARRSVLLWTASQTDANSEDREKLTGADLADDKGKLRHVTMALGLGKANDKWPDDAIHINVAAHRLAPMGVGCNIVPNKEHMRIYDVYKTQAAQEVVDDLPPSADEDENDAAKAKRFKKRRKEES